MTIPGELRIEIENLEVFAAKIEESALKLLTKAPLDYHPTDDLIVGYPDYSWGILTPELKNLQTKVIGKYRGWYQSSKKIVLKYLKSDLEQFEYYYQKADAESITRLLQLNFKVWNNNKREIIKRFEKGFSIQRNILSSIKFLEISESLTSESISSNENIEYNNKVFIVHGHDEEMKHNIENIIKRLELEPIILHQQPNEGRTIIEKFAKYSKVGSAIILLSPDDKCKDSEKQGRYYKLRARQNVIFEMGFFIGKLGRERVIILYKEEGDFEFPSDYQGVLYLPYDSKGSWKLDLVKELKSLGYSVDANLLV